MTVNNPDPDPRAAAAPDPDGALPPGGHPPRPGAFPATASDASSGTEPLDRPPRPAHPPGPTRPTRPRGWATGPLVAVCAIVLLVAAFFLAYALVLML
ncbi:DUF6480 family protein [Streptomyces sp. NPDC019645]|uniref:DUF6480 family protein n=1 Tax=unclassified Streptomyces TaxID=2593676 RepID=UPI003403D572